MQNSNIILNKTFIELYILHSKVIFNTKITHIVSFRYKTLCLHVILTQGRHRLGSKTIQDNLEDRGKGNEIF